MVQTRKEASYEQLEFVGVDVSGVVRVRDGESKSKLFCNESTKMIACMVWGVSSYVRVHLSNVVWITDTPHNRTHSRRTFNRSFRVRDEGTKGLPVENITVM